jgi:hypothetical protein
VRSLIFHGLVELAARDMAFFAQKIADPCLAGPGLILDRGNQACLS